jgi:hypothetical protein
MKTPVILLSTSFAIALLAAGIADAASAKKSSTSQTAGNTSYSQAMYQCTAQYAGPRPGLGRDRYAYIETCFKQLTGKYPADVGENCQLRRC